MKDEKEVAWVGDAKEVVCAFPTSMRKDVGYQIGRVQSGLEPNDWEPIERIGPGTKDRKGLKGTKKMKGRAK